MFLFKHTWGKGGQRWPHCGSAALWLNRKETCWCVTQRLIWGFKEAPKTLCVYTKIKRTSKLWANRETSFLTATSWWGASLPEPIIGQRAHRVIDGWERCYSIHSFKEHKKKKKSLLIKAPATVTSVEAKWALLIVLCHHTQDAHTHTHIASSGFMWVNPVFSTLSFSHCVCVASV